MSERGSGFGAFLLGVAVGAVVGFLFAPETGEDTRRKLSKRLRNLRDAAGERVDEVRGLLEAEVDEDDAGDEGDGDEEGEKEVKPGEESTPIDEEKLSVFRQFINTLDVDDPERGGEGQQSAG